MIAWNKTEEMICSVCQKPFVFEPVAPDRLKSVGCSCTPPREPTEIPIGAIITNFGGLWTIRRPKN